MWVRGTATPSLYIAENNSSTSLSHIFARSDSLSFASSTAFAQGVNSTLNSDIYMAWPQTGAIFASTPAPETAKLFMNFLLSDERQAIVGDDGFATRRTFDTAGVLTQQNVEPLGYGRFMSDRRLVESWRLQFERIFGTPQGPDPLDLAL
jgi:ABC-type Fe3+ transport system substrate-binding protein